MIWVIWVESVVNRTPDGPSLDSATSPTASQAVLTAQITNWRPHGLARPFLANGVPRRTLPVGSNGQRDAPSQKGACQINKWQERDWGHLPLRMPCREGERDETGRTGGLADRRDCKISPTKARSDRGEPQCWSESQQRAAAAASTIQALSSSAGRRGQGAGPPASNSHIHIAPNLAAFNINPSSTWPRLACLELHHPPSSTTAVARSIFVPVGRPLLLSLVSPYSQLLYLLNSRDNA